MFNFGIHWKVQVTWAEASRVDGNLNLFKNVSRHFPGDNSKQRKYIEKIKIVHKYYTNFIQTCHKAFWIW